MQKSNQTTEVHKTSPLVQETILLFCAVPGKKSHLNLLSAILADPSVETEMDMIAALCFTATRDESHMYRGEIIPNELSIWFFSALSVCRSHQESSASPNSFITQIIYWVISRAYCHPVNFPFQKFKLLCWVENRHMFCVGISGYPY